MSKKNAKVFDIDFTENVKSCARSLIEFSERVKQIRIEAEKLKIREMKTYRVLTNNLAWLGINDNVTFKVVPRESTSGGICAGYIDSIQGWINYTFEIGYYKLIKDALYKCFFENPSWFEEVKEQKPEFTEDQMKDFALYAYNNWSFNFSGIKESIGDVFNNYKLKNNIK